MVLYIANMRSWNMNWITMQNSNKVFMEGDQMVMTILEGRVSKENRTILEQAYEEASQHRDAGLERSYLIHATKESDLWRILTIWSNREVLAEMRKSAETPRGVSIFHSARSEPILSIFDIVQQITVE
jgi:heme-degrading monooxygenase HmoA